MTDNAMIQDLLAAQQEMPTLQKTALNPFYHNKYVPLESVLEAVLPILNRHNFVLIQQPTTIDGQPGLTTRLLHTSGGEVGATMFLCMKDTTPQEQGSGLTYARRYALLATLGLTADQDDDAEATRPKGGETRPTPTAYNNGASRAPQRRETGFEGIPAPSCPEHGDVCNLVPGGTSKASGKPYSSFYACPKKGCGANGKSWTVFADKWAADWQLRQPSEELPFTDAEAFAGVPNE